MVKRSSNTTPDTELCHPARADSEHCHNWEPIAMTRNTFKLFSLCRKTNGSLAKRYPTLRLSLEALENRLTPNVRFGVFGDYGVGQQSEQDVANLVHSWNPDFAVTTCDNNYSTPPMTTSSYDAMVGK